MICPWTTVPRQAVIDVLARSIQKTTSFPSGQKFAWSGRAHIRGACSPSFIAERLIPASPRPHITLVAVRVEVWAISGLGPAARGHSCGGAAVATTAGTASCPARSLAISR